MEMSLVRESSLLPPVRTSPRTNFPANTTLQRGNLEPKTCEEDRSADVGFGKNLPWSLSGRNDSSQGQPRRPLTVARTKWTET